ncbi:MAG: hypothetical protein P8X86_03335 [Desulfofustis sp.]
MIAEKLYRYSIDRLNGRFISGWCFNRFSKSRPVNISAVVDGRVLGRFTNDGYRPDLVEKRVHPSGVCGFDFSFPADFNPRSCGQFHLHFDSFKSPVVSVDCSCFSGERFLTHIERLDDNELHRGLERAHYLAGHLPLYELQRLVDLSTFQLISIIREPYAHLHSHLNYVKGVRPGSRLEAYYGFRHNETVKTLSDVLNRVDFSKLGEIRGLVAGLRDYQVDFFDNIQTRYFLDYRPERVAAEDLHRACTNISRFSSVGLTEAYERFKKRFCDSVGITPAEQKLQSNKAEHYRLFDLADSKVRSALRPLVEFDLQLYETVSANFWQNVK